MGSERKKTCQMSDGRTLPHAGGGWNGTTREVGGGRTTQKALEMAGRVLEDGDWLGGRGLEYCPELEGLSWDE